MYLMRREGGGGGYLSAPVVPLLGKTIHQLPKQQKAIHIVAMAITTSMAVTTSTVATSTAIARSSRFRQFNVFQFQLLHLGHQRSLFLFLLVSVDEIDMGQIHQEGYEVRGDTCERGRGDILEVSGRGRQ